MKRLIYNLIWVLFLGLFLNSCYKDVISPETDPDGPPQAVSFKEEIAPLVKTKCGSDKGCHVPGDHKPYLDDLSLSYRNLVNGGFVNTLIPKESKLYIQINGSMAEYIPSKSDRQKIYDWIRNGAPNN